MNRFIITVAKEEHLVYVPEIEKAIIEAAQVKGTGIAKRSAKYLTDKISQGKAIIALDDNRKFAGFCYIESWGHDRFVVKS